MQSNLRIGIISYRSNPHCGGQGVYVDNLSRKLADLGHRIEVIAGPPNPLLNGNVKLTMLPTLDLYNPDDLFRTPKSHELEDPINLMEWLGVSTMGYPEPFTFGMRAKRYLDDKYRRFDIIHDNQCLAYSLLSIAKHLPVTATIHHPMTVDRRIAIQSTRSPLRKFQQMRWYSFIGMQKYVARRIPRLITVSDFSRADISREFSIPDNRLTAIPIGIDTHRFHPLDHIKREKSRLIVTNSADTPLKGLYFLLHAIKQIKNEGRPIKLVVIGTPKKEGGVVRLIHHLDLSDSVEFTGRIDHHRFVVEYAKATLAIVPSLYEGFGLPVGEAMACRIPVICTTGGALPEVAGDAAHIVPSANAAALKDAIVSLLDDPSRQERLAQAGYDRVMGHFTWEKTAIKTAQVYREIIHDYR